MHLALLGSRGLSPFDWSTNPRFVGQADCYDPSTNAVYDWKTRSSWYNFDPPVDCHLDQIHVYMAALGADYGQVVYLNKGSMEVRTWPEDGLFGFDPGRFEAIVEKATRIRDAIGAEGIAEAAEEIPFEKCDCYFCSQETRTADRYTFYNRPLTGVIWSSISLSTNQPTRLQIFTHLYANGETAFTDLKSELDITQGNLASHIQKMEDADCVTVTKQFVDRSPQTSYRLTSRGEELFEAHIQTLEALIDGLDE